MTIHLLPVSLDHAPAVQVLAADPRIAATSNVPHPYPPDGAVTWLRHTMAQRELGREMNFAIMDGDTHHDAQEPPSRQAPLDPHAGRGPRRDVLVGVCGVMGMGGASALGEVGYWIGVPYWGRGLATAATRELLHIAFEDHRTEGLRSSCLVSNQASFRVLEKVGFRLVGYGAHPSPKWTARDRFAMFELTREEWQKGSIFRGEV